MLSVRGPAQFCQLIETIPNKVRLTKELCDQLKQTGVASSPLNRKYRSPRLRCNNLAVAIPIELNAETNSTRVESIVYVKNISNTGICLISHEEYFSPEQIRLILPDAAMNVVITRGRCAGESCYELGAKIIKLEKSDEV